MSARNGSGDKPASHGRSEPTGGRRLDDSGAGASPVELARQSFPGGLERALARQLSHTAGDPACRKLAQAVASGIDERIMLESGGLAVLIEWVKFANGTTAIRKIVSTEAEAHAEILSSLVGRAIGARVPAVYQARKCELYMEFMPGVPAVDVLATRDEEQPYVSSRDGLLLVALDAAIDNCDRHLGNWLIAEDGSISGIDHALALADGGQPGSTAGLVEPGEGSIRSPFARRWFIKLNDLGQPEWKDNVLHPADVDLWLSSVIPLQRHFLRRGYLGQWQAVVGRFRAIRSHAKGPQPWVAAAPKRLSSPSQEPTARSSRRSRSPRTAK